MGAAAGVLFRCELFRHLKTVLKEEGYCYVSVVGMLSHVYGGSMEVPRDWEFYSHIGTTTERDTIWSSLFPP